MTGGRTRTGVLGEVVSGLSFEYFSAATREKVADRFLDTVGVTLAGRDEPVSRQTAALVAREHAGSDATVLVDGTIGAASGAAMANATAGHALDFDDVAWQMDGHPSVTLVAPILAVGESIGANGRDAITAYVAGFEAEVFLATPISPGHYEAGWHATSTFGVFGAAAATAKLLDLDATEVKTALDIAASMPAGLKRNFGSMTKPLHVGHAVRSGITAASLASDGLTADERAVCGSRGFYDLYRHPEQDVPADPPNSQGRLSFPDAAIEVKRFPCCYFTQSPIASTLALRDDHDLAPEGVTEVRVRLSQGAADALSHDRPESKTAAKFSLPYTVAHALTYGEVGFEAFKDDRLLDETVRSFLEQVSYEVDLDLAYDSHESTVIVETTDGETHRRVLGDPPGSAANPLSSSELRTKFRDCATRTVDESVSDAVLDALENLQALDDVGDVVAPLREQTHT